MDISNLETQPRTETGSRAAERLRASGRYPAVVLGGGKDTAQCSVDAREFDAALRHGHRSFTVELEDGLQRVAIQDLQWDAFGDDVLHVDFVRDPDGSKARKQLEETA